MVLVLKTWTLKECLSSPARSNARPAELIPADPEIVPISHSSSSDTWVLTNNKETPAAQAAQQLHLGYRRTPQLDPHLLPHQMVMSQCAADRGAEGGSQGG